MTMEKIHTAMKKMTMNKNKYDDEKIKDHKIYQVRVHAMMPR